MGGNRPVSRPASRRARAEGVHLALRALRARTEPDQILACELAWEVHTQGYWSQLHGDDGRPYESEETLLPRGPRAGLLADGLQAAGHRTPADSVHASPSGRPCGPRVAAVGLAKTAVLVPAIERLGDWTAWLRLAGQLSTVVLQARVTAALQALPAGPRANPTRRALSTVGAGRHARHRGHDRRRTVLRAGRPGCRDGPSGRDLSRGLPGVPGGMGGPGRARSAARLCGVRGPRRRRWRRRPSSRPDPGGRPISGSGGVAHVGKMGTAEARGTREAVTAAGGGGASADTGRRASSAQSGRRPRLQSGTDIRATVLMRDRCTCQACGVRTRLEVHHVRKRSQGGSDFDLDGLVTLCHACHAQTDAPYARGRLVVTPLGAGRFDCEIVRRSIQVGAQQFAPGRASLRRSREPGLPTWT